MRRNLVLLDLLLLALSGLAAWRLAAYRNERSAERMIFLHRREPPIPAPALLIAPPPPPAVASAYVEVAQKLLLSPDRNTNVIIEVVAPKVMPALPRAYGLMDLGNGARVFLAPAPGTPQRSYVKGDTIGPFKLLEISHTGLVFGWEDKQVTAGFDELKDVSARAAAERAAPATQRAASSQVISLQSAPAAPAAGSEPRSIASDSSVQGRPGGDSAASVRPCVAGDNSPAGTMNGGLRKVIVRTPMGDSCSWEKVP